MTNLILRYISLSVSLSFLLAPSEAAIQDIFGSFFGGGSGQQHVMHSGHQGQHRTPDARTVVSVTLNELYLGTSRELSYSRNVLCEHCGGTGARDGATKRCSKCHGRGHIIVQQQVMPGFNMQTQQTCPKCGGRGQMHAHKCSYCRGNGVVNQDTHVTVSIERGMSHGQEIRFSGKSEERPGQQTGDLVVVLEMQKHAFFQRSGNGLRTAVELSLTQALLGFDLNIQHLDDRWLNLKHADITHHKKERVYQKEGMPLHRKKNKYGKLTIEYRVKFPNRVTERQVEKLKSIFPDLELEGEYSG